MANDIPVYERSVTATGNATPDFQGTTQALAASENNLGAIGAKVAQLSSNAIANQLGGDIGQNPHGDLGIPLTDFDKNLAESYSTQAHATLGLQAEKLITETNLKASSASRITPELISDSQKNISMGLQKIYDMAPSSIRPQLESTYGAAQMAQHEQLAKRMLSEQHEDRRNNTILSNDRNAETAHTLAASGNYKAAEDLVKTTQGINNSAVAGNVGFTPEQGKVGVDAVRQSAINGRLQFEYEKANAEKKGDEYLKNLATRPDWIADKDYQAATQSIRSYVSNQVALKSNYEELTMSDFKSKIDSGASLISGSELQSTLDKLSPVNASKLNLTYQNAIRTQAAEGVSQAILSAKWDDPVVQANASEKTRNATFNGKVDYLTKNTPNLSRDEAEVRIASTAAGRIPVFEKSLENKLVSGKPADILSAANQMDLLKNLGAGRVYDPISQKAKAIAIQFQNQRGSMPDSDLARKITDNLSNVDDKMQKTLDNAWNIKLTSKGAAGLGASMSLADFALKEVGLDSRHNAKLGGAYFGTLYGNDIYDQLNSNFIATRGDYDTALQMTKDYVDTHYGKTYVNGTEQISDSPIEKSLGYKEEATPYIQQDLLNQLAPSFAEAKAAHPDDYWETLPLKNGVAEAVRHIKTKDGFKSYSYPINLVGRAGNQWDVVAKTPYGQRNLFLVAPQVGVTSYVPNRDAIDEKMRSDKKNRTYIGRA